MFTWSASDLRGVSCDIIEHKVDIDPKVRPKKQKLRKMADDKVTAVKAEVQWLLDAKVIREVKYPTWLANTVPVKKKMGSGECILTSQILTRLAQRMTSRYQESTKWSMMPPIAK